MTTEITQYGTGERGRFIFDKATGKAVRAPESFVNPVKAPAVHQDTIEPTMSMTGTDKIYESRSALRQEYKDLGFIETGEAPEPRTPDKPKSDREQIRATVAEQVRLRKWGMVPLTDKERHERLCGSGETRKYESWKKRNHLK